MLQELTKGHISTRLHLGHTDEIGQMGAALDAYAEYLQTTIVRTLHALARGEKEIELVAVSDEQDEISPALNVMIQTILDLMQQVSVLIEDAKDGHLETRGDPDAFVGQYRDIVLGVNVMLDYITAPLGEASRVLTKYANVNFSARYSEKIEVKGAFSELKDKINIVGEHIENVLGQAIGGVKTQMKNLVDSSNTLQENLQTVETTGNITQNSIFTVQENAKEAQESIAQVSSEIENINEILGNISSKLDTTSDLAIEMDDAAKIGSEKTKATEQSLETMQASVEEAYEHMSAIFNEMQHISVIAKNIRSIADSTNILSLNAGLEAGRAGDFGESFGVIADEVKQLAEQSFDSAQEIANIIQKLKLKSRKADYSMSQAILSVETGATTITETVTTFREITKQIVQINEQISDIHRLTIEESENFKSITEHMASLVEKNADTLNQSAEAKNMSNKITTAIEELRETIDDLTNITTMTKDAMNQLR
jgi:methyl-accepting chemotaxis protein